MNLDPNPLIEALFHWLGGLSSASFYVPYKHSSLVLGDLLDHGQCIFLGHRTLARCPPALIARCWLANKVTN